MKKSDLAKIKATLTFILSFSEGKKMFVIQLNGVRHHKVYSDRSLQHSSTSSDARVNVNVATTLSQFQSTNQRWVLGFAARCFTLVRSPAFVFSAASKHALAFSPHTHRSRRRRRQRDRGLMSKFNYLLYDTKKRKARMTAENGAQIRGRKENILYASSSWNCGTVRLFFSFFFFLYT